MSWSPHPKLCAACGHLLPRNRSSKDFCDRCWESGPIGQKQRRHRRESMRLRRYLRVKKMAEFA